MAQGMSHKVLNHSSLVRALAGLADAAVPASKQSFAERLGQWIGFNEALSLYSALNPGAAEAAKPRPRPVESAAVRAEFTRVRDALVAVLVEAPAAAPQAQGEGAAYFTPYHRHYLARQRQMSTDIGLLRANVRAALSRHSPAMKRLSALDAVMDQALAVRERNLLATLPVFLNKRFEQLCMAHAAESGAGEDGQRRQPGDWLATFCGEMRAVLLAELELRLQPVDGLIAALENKVADWQ